MSGGRPLDLGPMYLPVGTDRLSVGKPGLTPARGPRAIDAQRLRAVLAHPGEGAPMDPIGPADTMGGPCLPAAWSLLGRCDPGSPRDGAAGAWAEAIEHWWIDGGVAHEREVRIGPRNPVLPGTAIHLRALDGALQVRLLCDAAMSPARLLVALPDLARDLAARWQHPVRVQVEQEALGVLRRVHAPHGAA